VIFFAMTSWPADPSINHEGLTMNKPTVITASAMTEQLYILRTALIAALLLYLANVPCLAWPDRSVRIVTPAGAGGGSDAVLRIVADGLAKLWKQPVVVENRPGADGIVAIADFIQAQGEHTLLFAWTGVVTANPLLHEKLPTIPFAICFRFRLRSKTLWRLPRFRR
jgi:tripartite-type tricarboxylate transporter receptor subunit TctC